MDEILNNPALLAQMNARIPRYTSYPTALEFAPMSQRSHIEHLRNYDQSSDELSLYIHIPFCSKMCLFCGCSVILNRKDDVQSRYVAYLLKEIELVCSYLKKKRVMQLHFGGGTPTNLTSEQFDAIFSLLREKFDFAKDAEIALEIDPRTSNEKKLEFYKSIGFNRISFGVQDTDPVVQKAVRRNQSHELSASAFQSAKKIGFTEINLDLIYGLPHQSLSSFSKTIEQILEISPDRIAMYSFAYIPEIKLHQKAIDPQTLPSVDEKFAIYFYARKKFSEMGYVPIGMDHFAKKEDPLSKAYEKKKLYRNFQGYAVQRSDSLIGLGVSSIGFLDHSYTQRVKTIEEYEELLDQGKLPVYRGVELSKDDQVRAWIIKELMCRFELDKSLFYSTFQTRFDLLFFKENKRLLSFQDKGMVQITKSKIIITKLGRLFIRNIASVFDAYLKSKKDTFSKAI